MENSKVEKPDYKRAFLKVELAMKQNLRVTDLPQINEELNLFVAKHIDVIYKERQFDVISVEEYINLFKAYLCIVRYMLTERFHKPLKEKQIMYAQHLLNKERNKKFISRLFHTRKHKNINGDGASFVDEVYVLLKTFPEVLIVFPTIKRIYERLHSENKSTTPKPVKKVRSKRRRKKLTEEDKWRKRMLARYGEDG